MIQRIVDYRVRDGEIPRALAAIEEFVGAIREAEPGTVAYHAYQRLDDDTRFVHTMTFVDEAARDAHTRTGHVQRFVDVLYPLCTETPEFHDIRTVASSADPSVA